MAIATRQEFIMFNTNNTEISTAQKKRTLLTFVQLILRILREQTSRYCLPLLILFQKNPIKSIDWTFWSILGFFCLCYQVFWSNFAELHVRLPFLKFPIFIGEFLLAGSLGLLFWKRKLTGFKFNRWYVGLFVYVGWVFLKALQGYLTFGPLALRNAALFYYPLFAVIAYHFYKSGLFTQKIIAGLLIIFVLVKMTVHFAPLYPPFAVFVVLALNVKEFRLKYFFLASTILLFSYKGFFLESKTGIISHMTAFSFLNYFLFFHISRIKMQHKITAVFLIFMVMAFGFLKWMHKSQLVSLATPQTLMQQFKEADEYIAQRKKDYVPPKLAVHVYTPNSGDFEEGELINPNAQHTPASKKKLAQLRAQEAAIFIDDIFEKIKKAVSDAVQKHSDNVSFDIKRTSASVAAYTKAINLLEHTTHLALQEAVQVIEEYKKTTLTKSSTLVSQPEDVRMLVKQTTQAAINKAIDRIDEEKEVLLKEMSISAQASTKEESHSALVSTMASKGVDHSVSPKPAAVPNTLSSPPKTPIASTMASKGVDHSVSPKPVTAPITSSSPPKITTASMMASKGIDHSVSPKPAAVPNTGSPADISTPVPQREREKPPVALQIKMQPKTRTAVTETPNKKINPPIPTTVQTVKPLDQPKLKPTVEATKSVSFPNALVGNPNDAMTRPPTKTFGGDNLGIGSSQSKPAVVPTTGYATKAVNSHVTPNLPNEIYEERLKSFVQKYSQTVSQTKTNSDTRPQNVEITRRPSYQHKDLKAKNTVLNSVRNKTNYDDSKEAQKIFLANKAVGTINEQVGFLPFSRADFDTKGRSTQEERGNMLFRLLVWRDMIEEFSRESLIGKILGINFGKPQRSISLEIYGQASGEWSRDGWIAPHNSFLHLIYRGGIVGLLMVVGLFSVVGILTRKFVMLKSSTGIWLMSLFVYWMTFSNFLLCLELPYQAIPFWSLLGMTMAYCKDKSCQKSKLLS